MADLTLKSRSAEANRKGEVALVSVGVLQITGVSLQDLAMESFSKRCVDVPEGFAAGGEAMLCVVLEAINAMAIGYRNEASRQKGVADAFAQLAEEAATAPEAA